MADELLVSGEAGHEVHGYGEDDGRVLLRRDGVEGLEENVCKCCAVGQISEIEKSFFFVHNKLTMLL